MDSSSSTATEMQVTHRTSMRGHTGWVQNVVHLPGGRHIITCSQDGSLRLWDLESGTQIGDDWRDETSTASVLTIALSPDGKIIASGGSDKTVKLWDVETGKVIARWGEHTGSVLSVSWSPDGGRAVTGSRDGTARVWDVENGTTVLHPIKTGHKTVFVVAYSPDGTKIATGGEKENSAKIWNSESGELLFSTVRQPESVWSLAWTLDGKKLISGGNIRSIRIFDTATWQQIAILNHPNISALTLSCNDHFLASTSWDKTTRLWNLEINLPAGPLLQHEDSVNCAAFSADGTLLVTACKDGNIYVWDIRKIVADSEDYANSTPFRDTHPLPEDFSDVPQHVGTSKEVDVPQEVDSSATYTAQSPSSTVDTLQEVDSSATCTTAQRASSTVNIPQEVNVPQEVDSSAAQPASSTGPRARTFLGRISSLFRYSRRNIDKAAEL